MSLNFFTSQQSFQKSLIDPAQSLGSKQDYTPTLKKNEFKTSNSNNNYAKQSEQNENFTEMMNSFKKKEAAQNKSDGKHEVSSQISSNNTDKALFQTKQSALLYSIDTLATDGDLQETSIDLANITALNAEIQELIAAQSQNGDEVTQITIDENTSAEDKEGLLALISSFLDEQKDLAKTSGNKELLSMIDQLQEMAESGDAQITLVSLTPQQLNDLQEIIQKYMKEELREQDDKTIGALAAGFTTLEPPAKTKVSSDEQKVTLQKLPDQVNQPISQEHHSQSRYDAKYDATRYNGGENIALPEDAKTANFKSDLKASDANSKFAQNENKQSANNINSGQKFLQNTGLIQGAATTFDLSAGQTLNGAGVQGIQ